MGGHALKTVSTRRAQAPEYHQIKDEVVAELRGLYPGHRIEAIPAYRTKPDFGDLDILLEVFPENRPDTDIRHRFRGDLRKHFKAEEIVSNGPVYSFAHREFQVDVILALSADFEMSLNYFAWNDLGNLIGRIAHKMGLKYGHDGLSLPFRVGTYLFDTLNVSKAALAAIEFLGFDPERFAEGFDAPEDFYQFVVNGKYFDPDCYRLENRSNKARTRDRKRPIYRGFLEWIDATAAPARFTDWPDDKTTWLAALFQAFPEARTGYAQIQKNYELATLFRAKFNGERVSGLTGLRDQELGRLMAIIRKSWPTDPEFRHWVIEATDEAIADLVKLKAQEHRAEISPEA
jgi:hypothetical protein